jgi:hypothetical protein
MKNKILILILTIGFYSTIFSVSFTNNTDYIVKIVTGETKKGYIMEHIEPMQDYKIEPYQYKANTMLIGFCKNVGENPVLFNLELPKEHVQINENVDSFFIIEGVKKANIIAKAQALKILNQKTRKILKNNSDKQNLDKNKPKTKVRTLHPRIYVICGTIIIAGYLAWNNYKKKSKINNTYK